MYITTWNHWTLKSTSDMHICHMNNSEHVENWRPAIIGHCQRLYVFFGGKYQKKTRFRRDFHGFPTVRCRDPSHDLGELEDQRIPCRRRSRFLEHKLKSRTQVWHDHLPTNDSLVWLFVCLSLFVCHSVNLCCFRSFSFFHVHLLQCARFGKFSCVFSFLAMAANWCLWFLWVGVDHVGFFKTWHFFHKGYQTHTLGAGPQNAQNAENNNHRCDWADGLWLVLTGVWRFFVGSKQGKHVGGGNQVGAKQIQFTKKFNLKATLNI